MTQSNLLKAGRYNLVESLIRVLLFRLKIEPLLVFIEWNVSLRAKVTETNQVRISQFNTEWIVRHSYRFFRLHILTSLDSTEGL